MASNETITEINSKINVLEDKVGSGTLSAGDNIKDLISAVNGIYT